MLLMFAFIYDLDVLGEACDLCALADVVDVLIGALVDVLGVD